MLVSAISMFKAISTQNSASCAMMQAHNNTINMLRVPHCRETNFNALHQQDINNSMSMATNQLKYKVASAWKKQCEARIKKEMQQNKLDYKA